MTDTTNPGGWPDATRPGFPLNPEEYRSHWVQWLSQPDSGPFQVDWDCDNGCWIDCFVSRFPHSPRVMSWRYIAPVLTPAEIELMVSAAVADQSMRIEAAVSEAKAEVAAQVAAARAEEREACAALFDNTHDRGRIIVGRVNLSCAEARHIAAAIRARGTP